MVPIETEPEPKPDPDPEVPEEPTDGTSLDNVQTDKIKVDSSKNIITVVPDVTLNDLIIATKDSVIAKNPNGEVLSADAKLATGTVVNDKYTVVMLGDVNGDGEVTTRDAQYVQEYVVGERKFEEYTQKAGDTTKDEQVTTRDAQYIQEYVVGERTF